MVKCKKCNSNNVKFDFDRVLTSIPQKYEYCCQDCGEYGYVNCNEVNFSDFTPEGYQKYQRPQLNLDDKQNIVETPKEENKGGGLMGWICPKCGRCYSPFTSMCPHCNNSDWSDWMKVTCLG